MARPIPIVLCSDNGYAIPLFVTAASAVRSKAEGTVYQFYCMVTGDFSPHIMASMDVMLTEAGCPPAQWIMMQSDGKETQTSIGRITTATFFRLQMPEWIPEEKCIYLDVDICVNGDLTELYHTDIDRDYIAAIRDYMLWSADARRVRLAAELNLTVNENYINSGVLVMNLKKMREDNLQAAFERLGQYNFPQLDQDMLFCACCPKIQYVHPKYNAQLSGLQLIAEKKCKEEVINAYSANEWQESAEHPVVIHYSTPLKPWMYPDSQYADVWWRAFAFVQSKAVDPVQWQEEFYDFFLLSQRRHAAYEEEIRNWHLQAKTALQQYKKKTQKLKEKNQKQKKQLQQLKSSKSYRLARALTWVPRRLKKLFFRK